MLSARLKKKKNAFLCVLCCQLDKNKKKCISLCLVLSAGLKIKFTTHFSVSCVVSWIKIKFNTHFSVSCVCQLDLVVDPGHEVGVLGQGRAALHGGSPASGSCQAVLGLRAGQDRLAQEPVAGWPGTGADSPPSGGVLLHLR